jgi:hypothetical protein
VRNGWSILSIFLFVSTWANSPVGAQLLPETVVQAVVALADTAWNRGWDDSLVVQIEAVQDCRSGRPSVRLNNWLTTGAETVFQVVMNDSVIIESFNGMLRKALGPDFDPNLVKRKRGMGVPHQAILKGKYCQDPCSWELRLELVDIGTRKTVSVVKQGTRKPAVLLDIQQSKLRQGSTDPEEMDRTLERALAGLLARKKFGVQSVHAYLDLRRTIGSTTSAGAVDPGWVAVAADLSGCDIIVTGEMKVNFSSLGEEYDLPLGGKTQAFNYRAFPKLVAVKGSDGNELASIVSGSGIQGSDVPEEDAIRDAATQAVDFVWAQLRDALESCEQSQE